MHIISLEDLEHKQIHQINQLNLAGNFLFIHANSPRLSGSLLDTALTSRSPLQVTISPIFCALVWDLVHFKLKTWIFLLRSTVSGAFLHVFSHFQRIFLATKQWLRILIVRTSCETSYNALSHSHWGLDQFVRSHLNRLRGIMQDLFLS